MKDSRCWVLVRGAGLVLGLGLGACSADGAGGGTAQSESSLRGTVAVYELTNLDGTRETAYALSSAAGERQLLFDVVPELTPGSEIEVWGQVDGDLTRVERFEVVKPADVATTTQELVDAPSYPNRSIAFVRVDIGGGINLSVAQAQTGMFGTASGNNSLKQYLREASYGTQDITGSVAGPASHAMADCSVSEFTKLANTLRPTIPGTFQHYFWYLGSQNASCGWSGVGMLGTPNSPQRDTWFNGVSTCLLRAAMFGRNVGLIHSSSMKCGAAAFADNPAASCTHSEYGDSYDTLGSGGCRHVNGYHKVHQGWLQGCNAVKVGASRTLRLHPLESECNGIQLIQIPMPKVRPFTPTTGGVHNLGFYYLELRTSTGFDTGIAGAPTVLVHVGEAYRSRSNAGKNTWILDMNPATNVIDGLNQGQSFKDPAGGISFMVTALSSTRATVQVTTNLSGSPTCLDGSTLSGAGPSSCN